jgi:O-antigen ligase
MAYNKIEWLRTSFSTNSLAIRIKLWQNTFTLLKGKAMITGLGLGAWLNVYSSHYGNAVPVIVHNSYLQLYCDAGILGFIAMILAATTFFHVSKNICNSSKRNPVTWIGIGLIGSIIAGAVFAIFDVTISVTYVFGTGYVYLVLPLLWIGAALISVVNVKLTTQHNKSTGDHTISTLS